MGDSDDNEARSPFQRQFSPGGRDIQRYHDFLAASAIPGRASIALLLGFGFGGHEVEGGNPQDVDAPQDPIADFLFVRHVPAVKQRAVAAHVGNIIYSTAHEMFSIVLPFLNEAAGGNVNTFSNLRAGMNTCNFLGAPFLGWVTDKYGAKCSLMLSHASSAAVFATAGAASSVSTLYLSALPSFFMHPFQTTMTVMSLSSERDSRAQALGRVGALYSVGFFVGSALVVGASFMCKSYQLAFVAAGMQIAATGVLWLTYTDERSADHDEEQPEREGSSILTVLSRPGVASILSFKVVLVGTAGAISFMTQQFAIKPFRFSQKEVALLMAYVGALQMCSQSLVSDNLTPGQLWLVTGACVGGSLIGMGLLSSTKVTYVIMLAPLALSFHAANTTLGSLLTMYVPEEEMGAAIGLNVGMMPAGQVLAVIAASRIYSAYGFATVPVAAGAVLISATGLLYAFDCLPSQEELEMDEQESAAVE